MTAAVQANPFDAFLVRYRRRDVYDEETSTIVVLRGEDAPERFMREVVKMEPDSKQLEALRAYGRRERRIAFRSGHGVGKSTVAAVIIVHHLVTEYPQKTACTAPTEKQLFNALYPEIKSVIGKLPQPIQALFDIKSDRIELKSRPHESFLTAVTSRPETPEALAGYHSANVLLVADEASGVHEKVFEAASGSMSSEGSTTLLLGNPVRSSGLFFDVFNRPEMAGKWVCIHSSCVGHPRISPDFIEDMRSRYGENSNAFRVRVLGEFPLAEDDTLIPFELVESAAKREVAPNPTAPVYWGVDVARQGRDSSALARRKANVQLGVTKVWQKLDLMQLAGAIKNEYDTTPMPDRPAEILIDAIGIGAGVADRLREQGLPARAVNVSEMASTRDTYDRLRDELWGACKEWLAKLDCRLCADDHRLQRELVIPLMRFKSNGKLKLESKDEMKKRGYDSPDVADAFVLTFAGTAAALLHGQRRLTWAKPVKRNLKGIV